MIVMIMKNNVDACSCSASAWLEHAKALAGTKSHGQQRGWVKGCGDDAAHKIKGKMVWKKRLKRGATQCMRENALKPQKHADQAMQSKKGFKKEKTWLKHGLERGRRYKRGGKEWLAVLGSGPYDQASCCTRNRLWR
jgi:hypothetical protein